MTTTPKWLVRKSRCSCHPGTWTAWLPGADYQIFPAAELALQYAVDPMFRARWKAGQELACQFPLPITPAMRYNAL